MKTVSRHLQAIGLIILTAVLVAGCVTAPEVALQPNAAEVQIGKRDPAANETEIGPIEATHGSGCGSFGEKGTYAGAYNTLKNKAAEQGATYVQILSVETPGFDGNCAQNEFTLRGVAYKQ